MVKQYCTHVIPYNVLFIETPIAQCGFKDLFTGKRCFLREINTTWNKYKYANILCANKYSLSK